MAHMRHNSRYAWVLVAAALAAADAPDGQPPEEPRPAAAPDPKFASETLRAVEDDAPIRGAADNRDEALAYDLLVLHARTMPADVLRKAARRELTFAHLFGAERGKSRGEPVHVAGRLRLLRWMEPPATLQDEAYKIKDLYEAWILIEEYGKNPFCVVVSELPAG